MAKEFGFPFTATYDPETGELILTEQEEPDRLYGSEDEARKNAVYFSSGVMLTPDNQLRVDAGGNMAIIVRMGRAVINGYAYELYDGDLTLIVPTANVSYTRIDSVILSLDLTQPRRSIMVEYREGQPSPSPVPTPLIRTTDRWELRLARITVVANSAAITPGNIADDRLDNSVCGISAFNGAPIDVSGYVNQFEYKLDQFIQYVNETTQQQETDWQDWRTLQEQIYREWVLTLESLLDETTAGNLLLLINSNSINLFDFNNLATWGDAELTYPVFTNQRIFANIKMQGVLVASRDTIFNPDGSVVETEKFYSNSGATLLRHIQTTTTFVNNIPKTTAVQLPSDVPSLNLNSIDGGTARRRT